MSIEKLKKSPAPHLEIADRIRKAIKNSNLTQVQFSGKITMHASSLSKYLAGHHAFSYEMLQKVIKYTNCDPDWLLTGQPPKTGNKFIKKQEVHSVKAKEYSPAELLEEGKMTEIESEYIKIALESMNKRIDGIEKIIESKLDLVFEKLSNMEKLSKPAKTNQEEDSSLGEQETA
jgi:transcriptional regulator with XRE-family HTH domain